MSARLTPEQRRLRAILEADWQRTVTALAAAHGWHVYHAPAAGHRANGTVRTTRPGFPDLTMWRGPRLLFAELKRETGVPTPAQVATLHDLAQTGAEVYLWRPRDLPDVRTVLGARR